VARIVEVVGRVAAGAREDLRLWSITYACGSGGGTRCAEKAFVLRLCIEKADGARDAKAHVAPIDKKAWKHGNAEACKQMQKGGSVDSGKCGSVEVPKCESVVE
jgi:hypothetical protein